MLQEYPTESHHFQMNTHTHFSLRSISSFTFPILRTSLMKPSTGLINKNFKYIISKIISYSVLYFCLKHLLQRSQPIFLSAHLKLFNRCFLFITKYSQYNSFHLLFCCLFCSIHKYIAIRIFTKNIKFNCHFSASNL